MSSESANTYEKEGAHGIHNGNAGNANNAEHITKHMSHEEQQAAKAAARFGYGPLAHVATAGDYHPAFGGEFQPGRFKSIETRKFGNPAPLGLCGFALTTFVLSLINLQTDNVTIPSIVIGSAFAYGGLCQLLAGMWELAVGNTFGGTALSSYGGFWIATAITLTPGGFEVETTMASQFAEGFAFYLFGWFIFTTILLIATLRSTVAFFLLFFTLDLAFLMLALGYHYAASTAHTGLIKAGGVFGLLAAFLAWYNALAGILDDSNSFFVIPVAHFPWSDKGREMRGKSSQHAA